MQRTTLEGIITPQNTFYSSAIPIFSSRFEVDNGLAQLNKLQYLWVHCNQLTSLPFNLDRLEGLKELDVVGNRLLEGAARLYEGKELHALQGWLAEFAAGSEIQNTVRIVLVGEGTSITCCFRCHYYFGCT